MKKLLSLFFIFSLITPNLFAGTLEMDWAEYSSDALAQAAYVTNDTAYGADFLTGGTASADSEAGGDNYDHNAVDNNTSTRWLSTFTAYPHWWKYDLGAGVTKVVRQITLQNIDGNEGFLKGFVLAGSNNDSSWTDIYTGEHANNADKQTFQFSNSTAYRYYRLTMSGPNWASHDYCGICEVEMMERSLILQSYSESTIKTQGSYSLKGVATTDALNKTLTKTLASNSNLTGVKRLRFDIRASRTGSNIKLGIHDTGGTTTEITPNVATVDTFQPVNFDLSAVSDANKDAIDSIILTTTNADSANTFYFDYFEIAQAIDVFGWGN